MAYDTRCYDLAEALAQTIQTAIEEWIIWERDHAGRVLMPGIDEYLPDNGQ
jgi:hypothetical protein